MLTPVQVSDIADRIGKDRHLVNSWRKRYSDFPKPRWHLSTGDAWAWEDVERWLRKTNRGDLIKPPS